ncbi:MAG: prolyl oligopeptidase family serine peptidase, partial [Planctomycetota bacterium]
MPRRRLLAPLLLTLTPGTAVAEPPPAPVTYPETRRTDHTDTLHGRVVADPYRWLEADVRESEEVAAWVAEQQATTRAYLDRLPTRERFIERLTELWNYERIGLPRKVGDRYLYSKNDGLQNQSVLYVTKAVGDDGEILIDPNTWSDDGTVALAGYSASDDGRYLAYQRSEAGSDWRTIRVLDLATGEEQGDVLRWIKFGGVEWSNDNAGFYYSRYPEPEEGEAFQSAALNRKLYYHTLGTPQGDDRLVYEDPEHPDWSAYLELTEDGRYEVLSISRGTDPQNKLYFRKRGETEWVRAVDDFDDTFYLIGETKNADGGDRFLLYTDYRAPMKRVVALDAESLAGDGLARESLVEVIPTAASPIESVSLVGGKLFVERLEDVATSVAVYSLTGEKERDVPLPGVGSAGGFGGKPDPEKTSETFFYYTSYNAPTTNYRYDIATGEVTKIAAPTVDFDPDDFVVRREFYDSPDGTRVPIFIAHKRGIERDHTNPTLLYAYGGFNISITPGFSPSRIAWLEAGGVLAVANLRGGGEYGEAWHEAGKRGNKQNVFDDFIAAAEWLVASGYTSPERLAIQGGSNGGLLVGAVMTQRPELFGACLPAVGVMDMLRFHKFTAGQFWRDEYGDPDDADDFDALFAYSPYHNLRPGTHYPATMVITADTDDRVVPSHSFKFAAALQHAQAGPAPTLLRVETRAGHGAGTPTKKRIEQAADQWAFLMEQ